jgi:hypothetical protein
MKTTIEKCYRQQPMQRVVGLTESWRVAFSFPLGLEPQLIKGNEELMLIATVCDL